MNNVTSYAEQLVSSNSFAAELVAYLYAMTFQNLQEDPIPRWQAKGGQISNEAEEVLKWFRRKFQKAFGGDEITEHQILSQVEIDVFAETSDKVYCVETTHHKGGYHPCDKSDRAPPEFFARKIICDGICGYFCQRVPKSKPVVVLFVTTRFRPCDKDAIDGVLRDVESEFADRIHKKIEIQVLKESEYIEELKRLETIIKEIDFSLEAFKLNPALALKRHMSWVKNDFEGSNTKKDRDE